MNCTTLRISVVLSLFISHINLLPAATYHVSIQGSDTSGDGSAGRPWRSIRHALSRVPADQGHSIQLGAGTFVEAGRCDVPSGVSLQGAGIGKTIITAGSGFYRSTYSGYDGNLFLLRVSGRGNALRGFTADGAGKQIYGGIMVQNASDIEIKEVKIQAFFFNGLWLWNTSNSSFHHAEVYDCSWGSTAWAGGAIHLYKLQNVDLYALKLTEIEQRSGQKGGGLAIKALGPGNDNTCENVRIYDCDVKVNEFGIWQNGVAPNISIEFWNVLTRGCEIRNSTIRQHISLVSITETQSAPLASDQYRFRILQNQLLCEGSYPLEISMSNVEVAHNYVDAAWTGYGIANWEKRGTLYENWDIHNNVFARIGSGWPSSVIQTRGGIKNLRFDQNTIHLEGPPIGILSPYGPNTSENIDITRNIILRTNQNGNITEPSQDYLIYPKTHEGIHYLSNVNIEGNMYWGFNPALSSYITGLSQSGNQTADPGLNMNGAKAFPFYEPKAGSMAIRQDAGARPSSTPVPMPPPEPDPSPDPPSDTEVDVWIRLNAGGESFTSGSGVIYLADLPNLVSGESKTYKSGIQIAGTEDDPLFQSERWGKSFTYEIPVPKGTYDLILHFAEIYWREDGTREISLNIEGGEPERVGLDIHKEVGRFSAYSESYSGIQVQDGALSLALKGDKNVAKIAAIEIRGKGTGEIPPLDDAGAIRINCGAQQDQTIEGLRFQRDQYFNDESGIWENETVSDIQNTSWDELYTSERFAHADKGKVLYEIPLPNGSYWVRLHFAEIYFGVPGGYDAVSGEGRRKMSVWVEGESWANEMDLAASPGPATALILEGTVLLQDGILNLDFGASQDRPKVSGIELIPRL